MSRHTISLVPVWTADKKFNSRPVAPLFLGQIESEAAHGNGALQFPPGSSSVFPSSSLDLEMLESLTVALTKWSVCRHGRTLQAIIATTDRK